MDFEKDLDLKRWQMISHLRPNLKKNFVDTVYTVVSPRTHWHCRLQCSVEILE